MIRNAAVPLVLAMAVLFVPAAAIAADERPVELSVVVKVAPDEADAAHDIAVALGAQPEPLIASRGVYRGTMTVPVKSKDAPKKAQKLSKKLADAFGKDHRVLWAQAEPDVTVDDTRFYAWPHGSPTTVAQQETDAPAALEDLHLEAAHRVATGAGVVVAVLDTGVDGAHPMLAGQVAPGYDMVSDDAVPSEDGNGFDDDNDGQADEAYGHGTFVAGVVRQVAPSATILPVRVLDDDGRGALHAVIEGIDYAIDAGADVINLSFGAADDLSAKALDEAVKRARRADVVVVAAAGNDGSEQKQYPAADSEVVSVTSADPEGQTLADFASYGKWIDVAAPGVDVVSALPHGGYASWDGSSVAAGVVSGQMALLRELHPGDDVKHIEKRVFDSANELADDRTHHGVTDVLASVE